MKFLVKNERLTILGLLLIVCLSITWSRDHKASTSGANITSTNKHCCKNGGLCILGSFCHCKQGFYGRNCEHFVNSTKCGALRHGKWIKSGCNLCRCWYGQTTCLFRIFSGCDHKPIPSKMVGTPDPRDPIVVLKDDDDYNYDENGYSDTEDSHVSQAVVTSHSYWFLVMDITVLCVCFLT